MMIWQDRNMSECFKVFYLKLYVHSLVNELKWFCKEIHGATVRFMVPDISSTAINIGQYRNDNRNRFRLYVFVFCHWCFGVKASSCWILKYIITEMECKYYISNGSHCAAVEDRRILWNDDASVYIRVMTGLILGWLRFFLILATFYQEILWWPLKRSIFYFLTPSFQALLWWPLKRSNFFKLRPFKQFCDDPSKDQIILTPSFQAILWWPLKRSNFFELRPFKQSCDDPSKDQFFFIF